MALNKKQARFRSDRASDLHHLAEVLEKIEIPVYQIREAANELTNFERTRKCSQKSKVDYSVWGYTIESLEIPLKSSPRHVRPLNLAGMSVTLSINLTASCDDWGTMCDPLQTLEFNIVITGISKEGSKHRICYHIDRHLDSDSEEAHPAYHFHFGGEKMEFDTIELGNTIFLNAPRLIFYPVDIILGLDFVFSNFFPCFREKLLNDHTYNSLITKYYKTLVKPFAHALASQWKPYDHHSIQWQPELIFPQLG